MRDALALIELASPWAANYFREKGEIYPMYHALCADGQHAIIPVASDNKNQKVGIADDPRRIEIVTFNAEDAEGMIVARRPIIRHKGRPHLGELHTEIFTSAEGRMVGLLPARGRTQ
jgi:hypothetical protein